MKHIRREISNTDARARSSSSLYLALALGFSLLMGLLGAVYEHTAVWAAGLACFGLGCVQCVCGYYFSRERRVVEVQIAIGGERPLSTSTL
jgi:hypothetical protein